ncbi:MAG: undecaprenyl-phosphate glucose phosphotransferase [Cyclobacteriaceae bacterium]|nr:undecaprenyl-phosphate glucose phosphotransferase [Cyclobacteriaceae bacterium]
MRYSKYRRTLLLIVDLLLINLAFLMIMALFQAERAMPWQQILFLHGILNSSWLILTLFTSPYQFGRAVRFAQILREHYTLVILHFTFSSAIILFQGLYHYPNKVLILGHLVFAVLLFAWRASFIYSLRIYRAKGFNFRNVIICGQGELSDEIIKFFRTHPEFGYKYLGTFDDNKKGLRIRGAIRDVIKYSNLNSVDEIYCCLPYVKYSQIRKLIAYGEDNLVKIKLISDFRGFSYKGLQLERYDHIPVLNVTSTPLDDKKNYVVKRSFDILFSLTVIIGIFTWLFPIVALMIKLTSRGPVFFTQQRTGKDNNNFLCYKFRTMRVNNDSDHKQATKHDNRITSIGDILRRTSIDELPQFFNVLLGDMSVVGPRPHMLKHTEEYSKRIEKFMMRHFVKPGITGLAQAKGYRGETKELIAMKNRVKLDRFYIENWSLLLDVKIIALTVVTLLKGDNNAY